MKTFIFFKKISIEKLIILGILSLLLVLFFILNQMVLAQGSMRSSQYELEDSYIEIQRIPPSQSLPLAKKENGKEEIVSQVRIVDSYLISNIPENEFLDEYPYLKLGFQDLSIDIEADQPIFNKENFYHPLSLFEKAKSLFGIEVLPEYRLTKEIDKSKGIKTNLNLSAISIETSYQSSGKILRDPFFPVKQTIIFKNNSDQPLNLSFLLKSKINSSWIYWKGETYSLSETPQKFEPENPVAFYIENK